MNRLTLFVVIVAIVSSLNAQQDLSFCDITKIPADPRDLPVPQLPKEGQYMALVEHNDPSKKITEEFKEVFDAKDNVAITVLEAAGLRTIFYAYPGTNELLIVESPNCVVAPLNTSFGLTPFIVVNIEGKEIITTPLNFLIATNAVKFVYIGSTTQERGIPVNQWQTCIYSEAEKTTIKYTLSYSDPEKWVSPIGAYNSTYTWSVPVSTLVESKKADSPDVKYEVYTISDYKYGIDLSIENFFIPPGIYCPNRKNVKNPPPIPKSFSFRGEIAEELPASGGLLGTVSNVRESYDQDKNMFRIDYIQQGEPISEIHDFNTGLRYVSKRYRRTCDISVLSDSIDSESDGINLRIRNPTEFFDLDLNTVQFNGYRKVNGKNTFVWIGPKKLNGIDTVFEWHFQTEQWITQETLGISTSELTQINIYQPTVVVDPTNNKTVKVPSVKHYNIFAFDSKRIDDYDFDLMDCASKIGFRQVFFKFPKDKESKIRDTSAFFRRNLHKAVAEKADILFSRISETDIIYEADESDGIYVTMKILERPSFYGSVNRTKDDLTLSEALKKLQASINSGSFEVTLEGTPKDSVKALSGSFKDTDSKYDLLIVKQVVSNVGYSGGSVAGFIIGFLVLGLLIGLIVGYLVIVKRSIRLPLPESIINPNFRSA